MNVKLPCVSLRLGREPCSNPHQSRSNLDNLGPITLSQLIVPQRDVVMIKDYLNQHELFVRMLE